VLVIVMENTEYPSIIGSPSAPYLNSLATNYGLATQWFAITHPSLPNYLALVSGSTWGVTTDCTSCLRTGTTLVDELSAAGIGWKAYMEDMPSPCYTGSSYANYVKRHNPFVYFTGILADPAKCGRVVPFTQFAPDLANNTAPPFMWVTPNLCNDMHDTCAPLNDRVAQGDRWVSSTLPLVLGSAWYRNGGKVVITWDEGGTNLGWNGSSGGHIATIVVSATSHGQLTAGGNLYGILRALEEVYSVGLLGLSTISADGDLRPLF